MRRSRVALVAVITATVTLTPALVTMSGVQAVQSPPSASDHSGQQSVVDVRDGVAMLQPGKAQVAATTTLLRDSGQGARVTWDPRFGTPRTIRPASGKFLSAKTPGKAVDVARAWVDGNRAALGLTAADVVALKVRRDHVLPGTGTHVVNFQQVYNGIAAGRDGALGLAVTDTGRVLSYTGSSTRSSELIGSFSLSPSAALANVAGKLAAGTDFTPKATGSAAGFQVFAKGPFAASSYVSKIAFPMGDGGHAAYRVLFVKRLDAAWDVVVDAQSGRILFRSDLVKNESEGTVYPNHPGAERGGQPKIVSFGATDESPSGYVDPTGSAGLPGPTTLGNNANSYANWSNFLVPADQGPRPFSLTSQFNYSYADNWGRSKCEVPSYAKDVDPAATNLFYQHNRVHDELYAFGFTETGGNFQVESSKGGQGGDPILGLVQAGAISGGDPTFTGRDNAYMLTLPDGIPPWSGMFLWEPIDDAFEGPCADGDFDATVIEHEYAHGLSNRYVGQTDNALNTHQSGSMGEGWGDWYALNYLHREGLSAKSVVGEYVTGNANRGIRNWPYDENPTGFGDIGYDITGPEVHADGEIWTTILWDLRKALVARYGQKLGSDIAARLVTDAMPLSPNDPSMLDMRDAILSAMDNRYHARGDFEQLSDLVYGAFASRGAGLHASNQQNEADPTGGNDTNPVPSFEHRNPTQNGRIVGRIVNASTGKPVVGAKVMLGVFEARVSPVATSGTDGRFSMPVTAGTYPLTIQARGFGAKTVDAVIVTAGATTRSTSKLAPNLASLANGAMVVSADGDGAKNLGDDTEASSWSVSKGGNAVVKLAKAAKISSVQVSAFTTSRFEGLRSFTLQVSADGINWRTALSEENGFGYEAPRPTVGDVHYRTFKLDNPAKASYVRFFADAPLGNTKTTIQVGDLQVFADAVSGINPTPPPPPDEPVTETFTIAAGNPTGDVTQGVTGTELTTSCVAPPASQGADGWVSNVSEGFDDGVHTVTAAGDSAAPYDLDIYFYNSSCVLTGDAASASADESGVIPSGAKYVLTQLYLGVNVPVTLTMKDTA